MLKYLAWSIFIVVAIVTAAYFYLQPRKAASYHNLRPIAETKKVTLWCFRNLTYGNFDSGNGNWGGLLFDADTGRPLRCTQSDSDRRDLAVRIN